MGGAPPPRSGCARSFVLHFVPLCNTSGVIRPTFLVATASCGAENGAFAAALRVGRRGSDMRPRRTIRCRSGRCNRSCVPPRVSLRLVGLPPMDVEGVRQGTSKGLDPHDSRHRAAASLHRLGARRRRMRRVRRGGWRRRSGLAGPGLRAGLRRGGRAADRRAPRRRARRRRQAPAHGRPGRAAAATRERRARGERRWVDVGEGLRAVARRGGRCLGERPGGARADLGGRRGDEGRRGGRLGARALPRGRSRRDVHGPVPRRDRLRGRRRGRRERCGRRLRRHRDRGGVQAHGRPARRRRDARGRRPVHERGRRARRRQPRPLLRRPAAAARRRAAAGPGERRAARAGEVGAAVRQARPGDRRLRGRRRGHGGRHGDDRRARGPVPRSREAVLGRRDGAARRAAGRRVGRDGAARARRGGAVDAQLVRRRPRWRGGRRPGQAGDRARPLAGHLLLGR